MMISEVVNEATVTISDKARSVEALRKDEDKLYAESAEIRQEMDALNAEYQKKMLAFSQRQESISKKLGAIQDSLVKLLR